MPKYYFIAKETDIPERKLINIHCVHSALSAYLLLSLVKMKDIY
ncbi:MAG: hypothetical protein ACI8PW_001262 [Methylophilaceae bacterium]|jgi:hypothetical protein